MDDLISRAAALEIIDAVKDIVWSQSGKVLCGKIYSKIKDIPAVEEVNAVDAIPVEWLWAAQNKMLNSPRYNFQQCAVVGQLIRAWQKEQEAR